jgi:ribulose-bisphosphate carboxylase large chain
MDGRVDDVQRIEQAITTDSTKGNSIYLPMRWGKMKPVLPIASGGLQPAQVGSLIDRMGSNICAQFGGGCHGHPGGTTAGAKAIRQALDAKLAGVPLQEYARTHLELQQAIDKWGTAVKRGGGE